MGLGLLPPPLPPPLLPQLLLLPCMWHLSPVFKLPFNLSAALHCTDAPILLLQHWACGPSATPGTLCSCLSHCGGSWQRVQSSDKAWRTAIGGSRCCGQLPARCGCNCSGHCGARSAAHPPGGRASDACPAQVPSQAKPMCGMTELDPACPTPALVDFWCHRAAGQTLPAPCGSWQRS